MKTPTGKEKRLFLLFKDSSNESRLLKGWHILLEAVGRRPDGGILPEIEDFTRQGNYVGTGRDLPLRSTEIILY